MQWIFTLTMAGTLGLGTGCTNERLIQLELAGGMDCQCSTAASPGGAPRALARTLPEGTTAVVLDFVTWDGGELPGCRTDELQAFCDTPGRCRPDPDWRQCIELDRAASEALSDPGALLTGWPDQPLPSGPGMLRLVAARQSCAEIAATDLERSRVFGCAYSCPLLFEEAASPVVLALDALGGCDERDVGTCALGLSTGHRVAAACCGATCE